MCPNLHQCNKNSIHNLSQNNLFYFGGCLHFLCGPHFCLSVCSGPFDLFLDKDFGLWTIVSLSSCVIWIIILDRFWFLD